ncbi:MAG: FAD-binding protein [Planctomycetota bacterium]
MRAEKVARVRRMSDANNSVFKRVRLSGWGRHVAVDALVSQSEDFATVAHKAALSRGLGRAYGDAALPAELSDRVSCSVAADRVLSFDAKSGLLRAEAGISLEALKRLFLVRGWFVPVTPGTQHVTLGGMVAADVHGKNHHVAGTIGRHVRSLRIGLVDGVVVDASREQNAELFRATLGGMGLTGHILEVSLQLEAVPSPWIWEEQEPHDNLDSLIGALRQAGADWPFTVAWADLQARGRRFGRGILMKGRWATAAEAPVAPPRWKSAIDVPFTAPNWLLGTWSIRPFNWTNYWKQRLRAHTGCIHPDAFFYPLDRLGDWNRLYGRRGFTQYQCVLPHFDDLERYGVFLERIRAHGGQVFLCVIKDCGAEAEGLLSFPKPGVSFALDIPIAAQRTQAVVDALNEFVLEHDGRVYLAKDAFTRREHFRRMEPRLPEWQRVRDAWDPARKIRSALSRRLLDPES